MGTESLTEKCRSALSFAEKQLTGLTDSYPDFFPMYTVDGKWKHEGETWTNWCEGFLGGQLWILYSHTKDDMWKEKAKHYSKLIEHRKTDRNVHDLGFLFLSTWKRWFDITGEAAIQDVVVEAGKTLALRFKEKGEYLRSFVSDDSLFIDIMMNVPIIYYAAQISGDDSLRNIADRHCITTMNRIVREDGSTAHEGLFNTETGEFLKQSTHQGYADDSAWARGQAWALYGFGSAYSYSKREEFLETAMKCADYYIDRTPSNGVPPNDWDEPEPAYPYESSAAAVTASGLIQLASLVDEMEKAQKYLEYAYRIVDTLTTSEFLADSDDGYEGILKHGIYHLGKGLGVDESVMWGEYFFLESLSKVLGNE